jgi:predicted signal transduction protein with EAL and GGDEF domain
MTRAQDLLLADEELRLRECAKEPIHVPGAIQPHGALLVVEPDTLEILQVSENCALLLGAPASSLLGADVSAVLGPDIRPFLSTGLDTADAPTTSSIVASVNGRVLDVIAHLAGDVGIVEFEAADARANGQAYLTRMHAAVKRLSNATDPGELRRTAVHEMRELTGFDQVMVYHFHPDGHGEVMADEHADGMTSYCGLHFPASDIPAQARRLYQLKGSGLIADSEYEPAALLPGTNPRTGGELDLSRAELRSVSPHHLQFMRNMGQGATFTLSLTLNGELLGLITCAHRSPRRLSFGLRQTCEVLAQQVVLQLDAMSRMQTLAHHLNAGTVRATLVEQMMRGQEMASELTDQGTTILDLIAADGAAACVDHRLTCIGDVPGTAQTTALLAALTQEDGNVSARLTESLALEWPELAALVPLFAGLLVQPFGNAGDCVVWFRREIAQTVEWLGPQSADNRPEPLSPRMSFTRWRQTVAGRCTPWNDVDTAEAAELSRDIDQVLLRRTEAQLAHVALHDSLTGLPNRRMLIDRITSALERADQSGEEVGILFCDLDDFKRVNDTAGHAAGDAVLIEAATRLQSVLRAGDSIARVGGDEFVVVLEDGGRDPTAQSPDHRAVRSGDDRTTTDPAPTAARQAALRIAERITWELTRPIRWEDGYHVISVSIGVTFATPGSPAEDLLRDADAAMYRAKQAGRNRVAVFDDSLRADMAERVEAEHALRTVLTPDRHQDGAGHPSLRVLYQPMIDLDGGRLFGFEAQLSMTDAGGQSIPQHILRDVAGRTGMVAALGGRVLETSMAALVEWRREHPAYTSTVMAITVSSVGMVQHADLPTLVEAALIRHGLEPSDLGLEITDSALITPGSAALRQFTQLHASGVGIAINDFGTGYANLHHLVTLPVDAIKVGASFTAGLPHDATSLTIVRAIAGLAADMDLACIFAGIDTAEQFDALPSGVIGLGLHLGAPSTVPTYGSDGRHGVAPEGAPSGDHLG